MRLTILVGSLSGTLSLATALLADAVLSARIPVIGEFAGLKYSLNPGIAWGIQLPGGIQECLIVLALVAVAYMASKADEDIDRVGYGMILGGGIANIIDRFIDGYVTDYFQVGSFPIFNVADSFVTIGVLVLLFDALRDEWVNRRQMSD